MPLQSLVVEHSNLQLSNEVSATAVSVILLPVNSIFFLHVIYILFTFFLHESIFICVLDNTSCYITF